MTSLEKGSFRPRGDLDRGDFDRGFWQLAIEQGVYDRKAFVHTPVPGGICVYGCTIHQVVYIFRAYD